MQQALCSKAAMRWTATVGPARLTPRTVPVPHIPGQVRLHHDILASGTPDKPAFPSFDSEDELDLELTDEFAKVVNPKKMQQVAAHLDLAWSIRKVSSPTGARLRAGRLQLLARRRGFHE
jgi:hypothetical protein